MAQRQNRQQKVWTSYCPYAKSKLKISHFTGVISVWTNWQGFQFVNQTFGESYDDTRSDKEWDFDVEEIRNFRWLVCTICRPALRI